MLVIKTSISKLYIMKMESNELKETEIKNGTCYFFDGIIKIEDFDFDNIMIE